MPSETSSFKTRLAGKTVIVKTALFSRAFRGTVSASDDTGFCFMSDDMVAALREMTGSAMADMHNPSVYLVFANLEWLVFPEAKAAAAHA